jgi:hypothetical protein
MTAIKNEMASLRINNVQAFTQGHNDHIDANEEANTAECSQNVFS